MKEKKNRHGNNKIEMEKKRKEMESGVCTKPRAHQAWSASLRSGSKCHQRNIQIAIAIGTHRCDHTTNFIVYYIHHRTVFLRCLISATPQWQREVKRVN